MGLTVVNVHFEKIKPTVRVMANAVTDRLEREQRAFLFIKLDAMWGDTKKHSLQ